MKDLHRSSKGLGWTPGGSDHELPLSPLPDQSAAAGNPDDEDGVTGVLGVLGVRARGVRYPDDEEGVTGVILQCEFCGQCCQREQERKDCNSGERDCVIDMFLFCSIRILILPFFCHLTQ